jgi:DNA-binding Lrp family transcriptional regulator
VIAIIELGVRLGVQHQSWGRSRDTVPRTALDFRSVLNLSFLLEVGMESQRVFDPARDKLDDTDKVILACIKDNPQATVKEIGEILADRNSGMPYTTLQKRVQRLMSIGAVRKHTSIDLAALDYRFHFRIDILINPSELREKASKRGAAEKADAFETRVVGTQKHLAEYVVETLVEKDSRFRDHIFVRDIHILLGTDVDLSIEVFAKDHNKMTEFVTEGLRNLLGVANTKTGWLAWSVRHGDL